MWVSVWLGVLLEAPLDPREGQRVVYEDDRYTVEKFIKNGGNVFLGGTNPLQVENWVNVTDMAFKALQVPHRHKTRLATCMLQEEATSGGKQWRELPLV